MRCPKCASELDKVVDSRISKDGSTIRRRRECMDCGHRYSTIEKILRENLYVFKRDGRREDFDKNKRGLGTGIVVNYPNPKGMIDKLYEVDDPRILPNYEVSIAEVDEQPPEILQVQLTDSSARKS